MTDEEIIEADRLLKALEDGALDRARPLAGIVYDDLSEWSGNCATDGHLVFGRVQPGNTAQCARCGTLLQMAAPGT